jgi:hypothetical protein
MCGFTGDEACDAAYHRAEGGTLTVTRGASDNRSGGSPANGEGGCSSVVTIGVVVPARLGVSISRLDIAAVIIAIFVGAAPIVPVSIAAIAIPTAVPIVAVAAIPIMIVPVVIVVMP